MVVKKLATVRTILATRSRNLFGTLIVFVDRLTSGRMFVMNIICIIEKNNQRCLEVAPNWMCLLWLSVGWTWHDISRDILHCVV